MEVFGLRGWERRYEGIEEGKDRFPMIRWVSGMCIIEGISRAVHLAPGTGGFVVSPQRGLGASRHAVMCLLSRIEQGNVGRRRDYT